MNTPDIETIDRYLAGELPPANAADVSRWMASRADRRALVETLQARAPGATALERPANVERGVRLLWGAGIGRRRRAGDGRKVFGVSRLLWSATTVVACAAIVLALGWTMGWHRGPERRSGAPLVYSTGNGERANIMLPDGNTVALNVASRLEVPMDYLAGDRTVRLMGEALFTVRHHADAPFTVLSGGTATHVLGTSFVVRRYRSDTSTVVAVREGKVAVGTTVVAANQRADVGQDGLLRLHAADPALFTFATGMLSIERMPLSAAIVELDRWYDADIRIGDATLATQPVTGEFAAGSLADLATMLEWTFNVKAVRDGRVLTLYPR